MASTPPPSSGPPSPGPDPVEMGSYSDPNLGSSATAPTTSSNTSLASEIQALHHESVASLDEAIARSTEPIKTGPGMSMGHQLFTAMLEGNRKLEREKLEMRRVIEGLEKEIARPGLNAGETQPGVSHVMEKTAGEMEELTKGVSSGSGDECEVLRRRVDWGEREVQRLTSEINELRQKLAACRCKVGELAREEEETAESAQDLSLGCRM